MPIVAHLVIVAGGMGSRLSAVAGDLPKVLVLVGGKPVLQHQLELAVKNGIHDVTIFAGHLADKISTFVGDGSKFGLRVRVLVEREPLGNAGAVLQFLDSLPESFFVVYGDVMLGVDLERMALEHLKHDADFTAMVHPNDHPFDSDLIETNHLGWVTALHLCPHPPDSSFANLVNAALYIVRRDALRPWASLLGKIDFVKDIMTGLLTRDAKVLAYRSYEYAKDMGTPDRLRKVEADWQAGKIVALSENPLTPAVLFDRDGTLNVEKGFLRSPDDLELFPDIAQSLIVLRKAGFRLVIVTNQPVIARGEASEADVAAIHRRLEWQLGLQGAYLDAFYHCPHHPDAGFPGERPDLKVPCRCRKPEIGMVESARRELQIDLSGSWMVGDRTVDVEMARRAGLRSILVATGAGGRDGKYDEKPDFTVANMQEAVLVILAKHSLPVGHPTQTLHAGNSSKVAA